MVKLSGMPEGMLNKIKIHSACAYGLPKGRISNISRDFKGVKLKHSGNVEADDERCSEGNLAPLVFYDPPSHLKRVMECLFLGVSKKKL